MYDSLAVSHNLKVFSSLLSSRMGEQWVSQENMKSMENTENREKMENINQMTYYPLFMIQNTLFVN